MSFYQLKFLIIKELVVLLTEDIHFPQCKARNFFFFECYFTQFSLNERDNCS